jgi:hypothetical protein
LRLAQQSSRRSASEVFRHTALLAQGQLVAQETRGFDEQKAETFKLRSKEDAPDYRYMPDPNLPPLLLTEVHVLAHFSQSSYHTFIHEFRSTLNASVKICRSFRMQLVRVCGISMACQPETSMFSWPLTLAVKLGSMGMLGVAQWRILIDYVRKGKEGIPNL